MSSTIPCTDCTSIMLFPKIGFGPDFERLSKYSDEIGFEVRKAITLGRQNDVLQALDVIYEECSEEGWDGYDAIPITEDAYNEASRLIMTLPVTSFIPMPDITPEPDGSIALEWSKDKHKIFVVSVRGKNEIVYAGIFGLNKTHGIEYFGDSLPLIIIENLKRLYL